MKKTAEQALQEWSEIQAMWEVMTKQMNGLEQVLFPLEEDAQMQRIGTFATERTFFLSAPILF